MESTRNQGRDAMNTERVESIVLEYAANKAEADRLTARNAELAEAMLAVARFKPGSDTGELEAAGYTVSVTHDRRFVLPVFQKQVRARPPGTEVVFPE